MEPDLKKLAFYSQRNYMKREAFLGYLDFSVGGFSTQSLTVAHNLGKIPQYDFWGELVANGGHLFPNNLPYPGMSGGGTFSTFASLQDWITPTTLTLTMTNNTGSTINRRVYYLIYKDY